MRPDSTLLTAWFGGLTGTARIDHRIRWHLLPVCGLTLLSLGWFIPLRAAEKTENTPSRVTILETDSGVRFGLLGEKPPKPAPTLIVLASTPEDSLGNDYFLQSGVKLREAGFICVSLDLPCHGLMRKPGEPDGLAGWRYRLDHGERLLDDFLVRAKAMLDHLIAQGYTDPGQIAAVGTSRGGFAALHLTAADPRVRCVAAMAPVTDLMVLQEFHSMQPTTAANELSVINLAPALVDRGVWIVIGDRDTRVGTDESIAVARKLSALAVQKQQPAYVDLLVKSEPRGHTTPPGAADMSADWIREFLAKPR